jgi:hypothetical protein
MLLNPTAGVTADVNMYSEMMQSQANQMLREKWAAMCDARWMTRRIAERKAGNQTGRWTNWGREAR